LRFGEALPVGRRPCRQRQEEEPVNAGRLLPTRDTISPGKALPPMPSRA
jgi:hypothetical protein